MVKTDIDFLPLLFVEGHIKFVSYEAPINTHLLVRHHNDSQSLILPETWGSIYTSSSKYIVTLASIWASVSRVYLSTAHRDCIGSIIFSLLLAASAKRVVLEYNSMVLRRACWAPSVMLSASSSITILWRPGGRVTCHWKI